MQNTTKLTFAKLTCSSKKNNMKYKKIKSMEQYNTYCERHEKLTFANYNANKDELELIEILIDEYENRTKEFSEEMNPVEIIAYLLEENGITKSELSRDLKVSRQLITDILNYRRNISEKMVTKLAKRFNMQTTAFSRVYKLKQVKNNATTQLA